MRKKHRKLPRGWTEKKIRKVIDYYEQQSDAEGAAEIEAAAQSSSLMAVPRALVPTVQTLIARYQRASHRRRHSGAR
jgi:hypothetical protein